MKGEKPALDVIGRTLRAMYQQVVQQPVPERIAKLLARLGHPGRKVLH